MKSMVSWFCLAAIANANMAFADDGLDAYRLGQYNKAAGLLTKASSRSPVADYYMARMYLYGYGQIKNNALAIRYFKQAADKGLLPAQQFMARYELFEKNNPAQALYWFKKSAEANDVAAQMYCAAAYLYGVGVSKNQDLAKRYYIMAAKNGNSIAQYTVAESFFETHQSANKKLGMLWLRKAVDQNNPEAQLMMAEQYISGALIERDLGKASELIKLAMAQNYQPAMYQMGLLEQALLHTDEAIKLYTKAATTAHSTLAMIALAEIYLDSKSSVYNPHEGYTWMLKAAQDGNEKAAAALSLMYKKGIGVDADEHLAQQWHQKSLSQAKMTPEMAKMKAVVWLTNGKASQFSDTNYAMQGIIRQWNSPQASQQYTYNQAPQMESLTRPMLYKPQFVMVQPNLIPMSDYYNILIASKSLKPQEQEEFPKYAINADANKTSNSDDNYKELFKTLESQAILGDSSAQFDLGQMYQAGLGVEKNIQEAIKYYQLAAAQQDLPSEYNLGLLYLLGTGVEPDYSLALEWLNDAAFKGNAYAQYVLANIYATGFKDAANKEVIAADPEQSLSMYNLAAANNFGPAQYKLAEMMVNQKQTDISVSGKEKQNKVVKRLYEQAVANGVTKANLPLAFYNAMSSDPAKQQQAFDAAKKEADLDNQYAKVLLGLMYDRGIFVKQDQSTALDWYQQATDNPVSAFVLGTYMADGVNLSKDIEKSRILLQQAADKGFSYANLNIGILKQQQKEDFLPDLNKALAEGNSSAGILLADYYLSQSQDEQALKQAHDIYQQFAEKGDKNAQLKLAYLYENGIGGAVDLNKAKTWYTSAALQGQPQAQYLLARFYQLGQLTGAPDYAEAKKWYSAAQAKYTPAAVALGFIYDTEDENYKDAMSRYQMAFDNGDMIGAYNLGLLYERGEGCLVDAEKARTLYLQASEKGNSRAMVQLAGLYLNGQGGSTDEDEAFSWYKKAMELGDRNAMYQLGLLSETGVATKLDYKAAIQYYKLASDRGDIKASLALARMYQYGLGVPKNIPEATKLYTALSAEGVPYAQYQMALFCFKGELNGCQPAEGNKWLQKAQENGSLDAGKVLQWSNSQTKPNVSFIESAQLPSQSVSSDASADRMYLDAVNAWNLGDEQTSKAILTKLLDEHPNNELAKQAYQQLMNTDSASHASVSGQNTAYLSR